MSFGVEQDKQKHIQSTPFTILPYDKTPKSTTNIYLLLQRMTFIIILIWFQSILHKKKTKNKNKKKITEYTLQLYKNSYISYSLLTGTSTMWHEIPWLLPGTYFPKGKKKVIIMKA